MRSILVTNDDGIDAPGLAALAEAMAALGRITVVAPDREMSGISHALTLSHPLRIKQQVREGWFAISGTPTDCVYIAIVKILGGQPDLVVSGINSGANLGKDVHYSGTVAGAVEGCILGVPAIAFSQIPDADIDLAPSARFAARLVETVLSLRPQRRTLLNVNFPPPPHAGVRLTRMGQRTYEKDVEEKVDPRGRHYYWIGGNEIHQHQDANTDVQAVHDGFISVTPLHLDLTDEQASRELAGWEMFREG